MGRSGGGGRSGGSFGGGRSSGGFGGGGRSSRSYSSSRSSSSSHRSYSRGPRYYGSYGTHRASSPSLVTSVFVIIFISVIILTLFYSMRGSSASSVPSNTKDRTALSGVVSKTEWYKDELNWIRSKSVLIEGLEDFYDETGVQPYILLLDYDSSLWINDDTISVNKADQYLQDYYDSHFKDEGHFIFAYFSCRQDSRSEMDGEFRYLSGYSADTIMDNEAIRILWGYFEKNYYNTSLSIEEMISDTFSSTGKSIMSRPTNGWDFAKVAFGVGGIVIVFIIIYSIIKTKAKREKEKEEFTKEILDKPLETFGDDTSELEKKYE